MNAESGRLGPHMQAAAAEIVDFSGLFATLWRGRWRVLLAGLAGAALGAAWLVLLAVPGYRASAVVVLQPGSEPGLDISTVLPGLAGESSAVNTEIEILRSRSLLSRVVERLGLDRDPEFNPALRPGGVWSGIGNRYLAPIMARLPPWLRAGGGGGGVATDTLAGRLVIRNIPESLVLEVMVETGDAEKSVRIVNSLTELYIRDQVESRYRAAEQAALWLQGRVEELKQEFEQAEERARAFAAGSALLGPESLLARERQLKELRARLADIRSALADARPGSAVAAGLGQRRDALGAAVAELESELRQQGEDLLELEQLQREAAASRRVYELFLARLKETAGQLGIQQAESRILSPAVVPEGPSSPRPRLVLTVAAALGLTLGGISVLVAEARDLRYREAAQLERDTGLPVLGQLPRFRQAGGAGLLRELDSRPASPEAEAVRNLRTALLAAHGAGSRMLAITSALPGEGKTSLSLALAHSVSGLGRRVLLVEADLRRPGVSTLLGIGRSGAGLVEVIGGGTGLKQALIRPENGAFDLLAAGSGTDRAGGRGSPADLFGSAGFARLLRQLPARYDLVIFDTPPVLAVSDALAIGRQLDGVLLAVRWGATGREALKGSLRLLRNAGLRAEGLVLTGIEGGGQAYGPGHGRGRGYG